MEIKGSQAIIRVLTVNIQAGSSTRRYSDYLTRSWSHALPLGRKRASLDAIAHVVGGHDIIGLQESDPGSLRSGFTNQTAYLARQAHCRFWSHQANRRLSLLATSANALLSNTRPTSLNHYPLPGRIGGRGILVASYGVAPQGLSVAVTHLSLGANSRRMQLAYIAERLCIYPNIILMGDFNCTADHPDMQLLYQNTHLCRPEVSQPTFPSWQPKRAIDHIFISPSLSVVATQTIQAACSDHLALSMQISLPKTVITSDISKIMVRGDGSSLDF